MTRARDLAAFVSNADGDIKFDTDTLFVDSSANRVGIGKTNPDVPLHIDMGTDNNAFYIESSDQFANIGLVDGSGSGKIIMDGGELAFTTGGNATTSFTNSAERMRIDADGDLIVKAANKVQLNRADNARSMKLFTDNNFGTVQTTNDPIKLDGQSYIRFDVSGTEEARLTSDGLTFNGDTAADNALNDYEQGTWTADAAIGSLSPHTTATYTKIGDLVTIYFDLRSFTETSSGTDINITGLPFAATKRSAGACMFRYWDTSGDGIVAYVDTGLSTVRFIRNSTGQWDPLDYNMSNGANMILAGTITYKIS